MKQVVVLLVLTLCVGCGNDSTIPVIPNTDWTLASAIDDSTCRLGAFNDGLTSGVDGGAGGSHWECVAPGTKTCSGDNDEFWFELEDDATMGRAGCGSFTTGATATSVYVHLAASPTKCVIVMPGELARSIIPEFNDADSVEGRMGGTPVGDVSCSLVVNP